MILIVKAMTNIRVKYAIGIINILARLVTGCSNLSTTRIYMNQTGSDDPEVIYLDFTNLISNSFPWETGPRYKVQSLLMSLFVADMDSIFQILYLSWERFHIRLHWNPFPLKHDIVWNKMIKMSHLARQQTKFSKQCKIKMDSKNFHGFLIYIQPIRVRAEGRKPA